MNHSYQTNLHHMMNLRLLSPIHHRIALDCCHPQRHLPCQQPKLDRYSNITSQFSRHCISWVLIHRDPFSWNCQTAFAYCRLSWGGASPSVYSWRKSYTCWCAYHWMAIRVSFGYAPSTCFSDSVSISLLEWWSSNSLGHWAARAAPYPT